jgi:hypothetical protein
MIQKKLLANKNKLFESGFLQSSFCFLNRYNLFDLLVIVICIVSFCCSLIESMVNCDNQHWGWAYITALNIKRGAIPHSEVIIHYGYIYTWIQSIALSLFGQRLISVGIITGLFYSLTLFLSYLVFLRFLKKSLAFVAVLLIFLIHPYIIYPLANYFAYTFQLLALIFFLRYSKHHYNSLLAGFFLSMSVLSRYSSVIAILPPFIILLLWDFFALKEERKITIKKILMVTCGFLVPLALFFSYLLANSALDDFFYQNKMLINLRGGVNDLDTYLNFLASIFQVVPSLASDFRGKLFTIILIVCLFILVREFVGKISGGVKNSAYARYDLMAVCLVAVFGYLNSIHVYETFRLVNGASIGVGICVLVFYNYFSRTIKPLKYLIVFTGIFVCLFLSSSLLFKTTTSSYYPWKRDVLFGNGVTNKTIGIFEGKILTKEYNDFYQEVFDTIEPFKNCCYILNYTQDIIAFSMNDLPRVQISPVHLPGVDDISKQQRLINQNKAVILSFRKIDLPGYSLIFAKKWPEEIPWFGGGYLFIYAPEQYSGYNKTLP